METGIGHVADDGMFGRQPMAKIRPPVGRGGRVSHTLNIILFTKIKQNKQNQHLHLIWVHP